MIYSTCNTCGETVYRYTEGSPKAGQMGNATQDCWHYHYSPDHPDHLPTWSDESAMRETITRAFVTASTYRVEDWIELYREYERQLGELDTERDSIDTASRGE